MGDCKLIKKIYFEENADEKQHSICFVDKKRTKSNTMTEKNKKSVIQRVFGRKLANNLQNTYLKGVNYLINKNLESRGCPNKFLDEYDIQEWNSHIYTLSDEKYHKKMMLNLEIPIIN